MQLIYRTCAYVWIISIVAVWAAEAATFPIEVRAQLEKQRKALRTVYIEFEKTMVRNGGDVSFTNTAYFDGDRFRVKAPSDVSFDGEMLWLVSERLKRPSILRKTQIRNTTETTPSFNELYWRLPYFEAAGIYFPPYPKDVRAFESLEPIVLRFLENSDPFEIMPEGANLRLRFSVDDWVLLNSREIDQVMFQKQLSGMPISPEMISNEVSSLQNARAMVPKRTVSMLLDSNHSYFPLEREDRSADGGLIARYGVEEWKYFADVTLWFPTKCVVSYFTNAFQPESVLRSPVQTIQINLKNAEFTARKTEFVLINTAKYRVAGTEVHDETISNSVDGVRRPVMLTIAADGTLLNEAIPVKISGNRRSLILIVLFILAAPPVLFLLLRSKLSKQ